MAMNQNNDLQYEYYQQDSDNYSNHNKVQGPTSGKAITAMVLGILSLIVPYVGLILGIIGIIFANKAFKEINEKKLSGRGMAVAGLTTSIIGVALYALVLLLVVIVGVSLGL